MCSPADGGYGGGYRQGVWVLEVVRYGRAGPGRYVACMCATAAQHMCECIGLRMVQHMVQLMVQLAMLHGCSARQVLGEKRAACG
jgi:hypothetical protein